MLSPKSARDWLQSPHLESGARQERPMQSSSDLGLGLWGCRRILQTECRAGTCLGL